MPRRRILIAGEIEIPPDWHPERDPAFLALMRPLLDRRPSTTDDTHAPSTNGRIAVLDDADTRV